MASLLAEGLSFGLGFAELHALEVDRGRFNGEGEADAREEGR